MSVKDNTKSSPKIVSWKIRVISIFANAGQWFIIPYAGTALAQTPSIEVAGFSMVVGLIASASREGLDVVREHSR